MTAMRGKERGPSMRVCPALRGGKGMAGSPRPGLGLVRLILLYLPFGDRGLRWKARMPWGMQYVFPRGSE